MKNSSGVKIVIIGMILAALVVGYFFHLTKKGREAREEVVESTQVQAALMRDLDKRYPPSPKEVIEYFNEISICFYNQTYTDEELYELAMQIQKLYDAELIANKTEEQYMEDLKAEIQEMKANDRTISSCQLSASTDVEFFYEGDDYCARLYCLYNVRQKTAMLTNDVIFILRQDEDKHWKILGWDVAE